MGVGDRSIYGHSMSAKTHNVQSLNMEHELVNLYLYGLFMGEGLTQVSRQIDRQTVDQAGFLNCKKLELSWPCLLLYDIISSSHYHIFTIRWFTVCPDQNLKPL